jgi:chaperonin cofactor prefoldin
MFSGIEKRIKVLKDRNELLQKQLDKLLNDKDLKTLEKLYDEYTNLEKKNIILSKRIEEISSMLKINLTDEEDFK